jgi:hypothetical protein
VTSVGAQAYLSVARELLERERQEVSSASPIAAAPADGDTGTDIAADNAADDGADDGADRPRRESDVAPPLAT